MTRGRRLLVEVALLGMLYLASLPNPGFFTATIKGLVLVTLPIVWSVAGVLLWSSRQAPHIETLRERADDAVTSGLIQFALFLVSFGPAALAWFGLSTPQNMVLVLLSWVAILNAVPSIGWMGTWRDVWVPLIRAKPLPADDDPDHALG